MQSDVLKQILAQKKDEALKNFKVGEKKEEKVAEAPPQS